MRLNIFYSSTDIFRKSIFPRYKNVLFFKSSKTLIFKVQIDPSAQTVSKNLSIHYLVEKKISQGYQITSFQLSFFLYLFLLLEVCVSWLLGVLNQLER